MIKIKQWFLIICILLCVFVNEQDIHAESSSFQVAFVRNGDLWTKINREEQQLTKGGAVTNPKWSFDGTWLAYKKKDELWAYHMVTKKHFLLYKSSASNYQWSPVDNVLAFQYDGTLNIIDMSSKNKSVSNISVGIGNYSWSPDGKEFLASSTATIQPTGWTNVELYKIPIDSKKKIEHFYTLPTQSKDFFAIQTSQFKYSEDGMWIAFLAIPTASWSMDENRLCMIRTDGTNFMNLDSMILNDAWFKWAPTKNFLAYISGEGRMAIEDKHLKVKVLPTMKSNSTYTPKGYVDWDFTWHNPSLITIARAKESEWSNNPSKRPLPSLYQIDTKSMQQNKITSPKSDYGDYRPEYISKERKLTWLRSNRQTTDMWLANIEGKQAKMFIQQIDTVPDYYEKRNWDEVIDIFQK